MHQSSDNWKLGLSLSLVTATLWGMLPIALKGLLVTIDSVTITWYRFIVSVILVGLILLKQNRIPDLKWLTSAKSLLLFAVVIFGLSSNYVLYLMGLDLVTPSAAQILIQLAPLLLLLGGIALFKETFSLIQWLGVVVFISGLGLFFNRRIEDIIIEAGTGEQQEYVWGLTLIFIAAITWSGYALAQKQLLTQYGSQQILFIAYIAASLLFLPDAQISSVLQLNGLQWGLLVFCCLNTLFAYGCFAEALDHWEASRVGAVLAITPLMTIAFAYLTDRLFPEYMTIESINGISLAGAVILVIGSLTAALAKGKH